MSKSACICLEGRGPGAIYSYPTPGEDGSVKELIEKHGYLVVRGLISQTQVEETRAEISSIVRDWYAEFQRTGRSDGKDWEEIVNRMPAWKNGEMEPSEPELGIRRLFRVAVKNEYFANLARHEKVCSSLVSRGICLVHETRYAGVGGAVLYLCYSVDSIFCNSSPWTQCEAPAVHGSAEATR